jgi:hypothetical protein
MRLSIPALITLILLSAAPAHAGIRPSFSLDNCSWFATHVVVAAEGERVDGRLTVLESWKGDLRPGEVINVPELAAFRAKSSRLIRKGFWDESSTPPEYVTGARMVLFLKEKPKAEGEDADSARVRSWEPAGRRGGMNVSVLWVEGDQTHGFVQVMNPGDSILIRLGKSEGETRDRFSEVVALHDSLNRAATIRDASARAEALEQFTASELYLAREAAFEGLRGCGRAAPPVLRRMLHDRSRLKVHGQVIKVMAEIGGEGVGEELTAVVGEELDFWRATAPGLGEGWWNEINKPETELLRDRYTRVYDALLGLKRLKYAGCRAVVTEFRDFWRSLPQLEDRGGLNQMSEACDEILSQLR